MSIELLAQTLISGSKVAQIQAAKALGETKSEDAIWPLTQGLKSEHEDVRIACANSLGLIGTESAAQTLLTAVADKTIPVKLAAIEALGNMRFEGAIEPISTAMHHKDKNVKIATCIALGKIGGSQSAFSIAQILLEKDQSLRTCAANSLMKIESPAILELLKNNINDKNVAVRATATFALGKYGQPEDMESLIPLLEDKNVEVKVGALQALQGKSVPVVVPTVAQLLTDKDEQVAVLASVFMADNANRSILDHLIQVISKVKFVEVRRNLFLSFGQIKEPAALELLISGLKDKDEPLRINCARALQKQAAPEAAPSLIAALKDPDPNIRQEIITALAKTKAIDTLLTSLDDKDELVITGVVTSLGLITDPSTLDKLYSLLDDPNGRITQEVLNALQNFKEFNVIKIANCAQHPDKSVRETLAITLGFNSSQESIKLLRNLIEDNSLNVRLAVINSFNRIGKIDAVVPLYQRYRESSDDTEKKMISQILVVLGQRNESQELIDVFNALFSGKAVEAERLASSLKENTNLLDDLIQDKDPQIRLVSLQTIDNRGLKEKQELVVELLTDPELNIRKTAVETLANIGDPSIIPILSTAVEKPENKSIRDVFIHNFIAFADPVAAPALVSFLADEDEDLRNMATEAFSKLGKEAITPLVNALDYDSPTIRSTIVKTLITFKEDVIPAVSEALRSENPIIQKGAIEVLGGVGTEEQVKTILSYLKSENIGVQCASAWAISKLGTETEKEMVLETTQTLINALNFPAEEIKNIATKAIQSLSLGYYEVVEGMQKLNSTVPETQEQGILMLAQAGTLSLPALKGALQDSNENVRVNTSKVLSKIDSYETIDLMLAMYQDSNEEIRNLAFDKAIDTKRESAIPVLIHFLGDPDTERIGLCIEKLVEHGSQSIKFAIKGLENVNSSIRRGSVIVLGKIKTDVPVEPLLKGLSDSDRGVKLATIRTLGQLEAEAQMVAKEIGKLALIPDLELQKASINALASIGSVSSAPILLSILDTPDVDEDLKNLADKALDAIVHANPDEGPLIAASKLIISPDSHEREQAINEFAKIGPKALETLETYLENPKISVRVASLEALIQINAIQVVNSIVARLQDPEIIVVQTALKALGVLGTSEVAGQLIPFLAAPEVETQLAAHKALEMLKPKEILINAMTDKKITIRQHAILLVGEIKADEATPQVIEFLQDPRDEIRTAAAKTLGLLQADTAIEPLINNLLDKKENVVAATAISLSQLKAINAVPWLYHISRSAEVLIQKASREALNKMGEDQQLIPLISSFEQIYSEDPNTRQSGISSLAELDSSFEEAIIEGLKIPDDSIRASTLRSIGLRGKKENSQLVVSYLSGHSKEVHLSAIASLGILKDINTIPHLVEYGLSSKDEHLHAAAVDALITIGSEGIETIGQFLQDKNKYVRSGAVQVLGKLQGEQFFDSILAMVEDKSDNVKLNAINALIELNNPAAVPKVASILTKENTQIRISALNLLRALRGYESLYQIYEMSRVPVPEVSNAALDCIEEFESLDFVNEVLNTYTELTENPDADVITHIKNLVPLGQGIVPLLSGAIYSSNAKIRELSIRAQSELGVKKYLPTFQEAMRDKAPNVRIAASNALYLLPDESSIEVLIEGLHDRQEEVQKHSIDAIMKIGEPCTELMLQQISDIVV
ncbi:MAG: HEAT repeat domain-containing protein [Promethearchaeota archaeon]